MSLRTGRSCAPCRGAARSGWLTGGCASPCGRGFPPATFSGPSGAGKRQPLLLFRRKQRRTEFSRRRRCEETLTFRRQQSAESLQKKPHAKAAKGAKGQRTSPCIHRSFTYRLVTYWPERSFPVPSRPSRSLREALSFQLTGYRSETPHVVSYLEDREHGLRLRRIVQAHRAGADFRNGFAHEVQREILAQMLGVGGEIRAARRP